MEFSSQNFHFNLRSHNQSLKKESLSQKSATAQGNFHSVAHSCPCMVQKWLKKCLEYSIFGPEDIRNSGTGRKKSQFQHSLSWIFPKVQGNFPENRTKISAPFMNIFLPKKSPLQPSWPCEVYFCEKSAVLPKTLKIHASWGMYGWKNAPNDKKTRNWSFRPKFVLCFSASQRNLFVTNKVV